MFLFNKNIVYSIILLIISLLAIFAGRHAKLVLESAGDRQAGDHVHQYCQSVEIVFTHVFTLYCFYSHQQSRTFQCAKLRTFRELKHENPIFLLLYLFNNV
jgi:hypothetical protein